MPLRTLAMTYLVIGIIELVLVLAVVGLFAFLIILWSFDPSHQTDWSKLASGIPIALAALAYPIPSILSGYGMRRDAPWSYRLAWIATALHAINFPIGTAIAVWGVLVLRKPETQQALAGQGAGHLGPNRPGPVT